MTRRRENKRENKKDQMSHFDTIAARFERRHLFQRENRNHIKKAVKLVKLLHLRDGFRVLEVGVGSGIHAKFIIDRYDVHYVGVDISRGLLKEAQKKFTQDTKPSFVACDAERLPFREESFDAIFCSGVLHHFPNPDLGIKEMAAALKERCFLAAMEPNWLFPTNLYAALTSRLERQALSMRPNNLSHWGAKAGLTGISVGTFLYTPPVPKFLHRIYDIIDDVLSKIPVVRFFSIMLYLHAQKIVATD